MTASPRLSASRLVALVLLSTFTTLSASAGSLVWEDDFSNGQELDGESVVTSDVTVTLSTDVVSDNDSGSSDLSPFGTNTLFGFANHTEQGGHDGYAFLGFDNLDNDPADYIDFEIVFSSTVSELSFSLLDIDQRTQGGTSDFSDAVVITYNNGTNIITSPSLYTLSSNVAIGDEGFGEFEGVSDATTDDAAAPSSTVGNIAIDFGGVLVTQVNIRYFSTDDAPADPSGQILGVSDLAWMVPEPGTGMLLGAGLLMLSARRRSLRA